MGLFKVRVGVILIQEEKLLLVRQNNRPFWVFPGGTLEKGESMVECAVREMKEETGFTVQIAKLLYVADFMHPEKQTIDVFFLANKLSGELDIEKDGNINEIEFVPIEDLSQKLIQPALVACQLIKDFQQGFQQPVGLYLGKYAPC